MENDKKLEAGFIPRRVFIDERFERGEGTQTAEEVDEQNAEDMRRAESLGLPAGA